MARFLIVLIVLMLAISGYLIVTNYQSTYKLLPGNTEHPIEVSPYANWHNYAAENGLFSVLFPMLPQRAQDTLPDPLSGETRKYDMYVSEMNNGSIFMISLITYSGNAKLDQESLLNSVRDEMVASHPTNKLVSEKKTTFEGYPAIDFSIENSSADIDARAFFVGKTLYLLTYVAKKEHYNRDEFDHFMNSFKLLSKGQKGSIPTK